MATSNNYFARSNYFLSSEHDAPLRSDTIFELDESELWNMTSSNSPEFRKPMNQRFSKKASLPVRRERNNGSPASMPVNVPDWAKILKEEYSGNQRSNSDEDDDDFSDDGFDGSGSRIPPHEFVARQLARTRIVSFSVHEGIGRTLKGRDLSRVRNAIWEKTGFQD